MSWLQQAISVGPFRRGFHLITPLIVDALPALSRYSVGWLQVFIQHTSASLTINENADREVRSDLEAVFNQLAPESFPYEHTYEGPDDMPAHVKASLLGSSIQIPITGGRLALGTWQGIYLCEHRNHAGPRNLVLTIHGQRS
ncbi:MAG: YjbQ family protein [Planctomycetota bacterium]|nr:MAG: YjbQ family protein [Planctomycetota bacterium]